MPNSQHANESTQVICSKGITAGNRTYQVSAKTTPAGKPYVSIVQKYSDGSQVRESRMAIFQPHLLDFLKTFVAAAALLEPKLQKFDVASIRENYPNAFDPWLPADDQRLRAEFQNGREIIELAQLFGRQPGGIRSRLRLLGLLVRPNSKQPALLQISSQRPLRRRQH